MAVRPLPEGVTPNEFGTQIIRWGRGDAEARNRIKTITADELRTHGVTAAMAEAWLNFYRAVKAEHPANPSAAGRADLMEHIAKLLEESL